MGKAVCFGLLAILAWGAVQAADDWQLLGRRMVKFRAEQDVIPVTSEKGHFRKIKLRVQRNGIRFIDLKVHFANGEVHDVTLRSFIKAGGETRVIDLPGGRRVIRKVSFLYKTGGAKKGRALVQLWGK